MSGITPVSRGTELLEIILLKGLISFEIYETATNKSGKKNYSTISQPGGTLKIVSYPIFTNNGYTGPGNRFT
jgi:hypothetical protein